MIGNKEINRLAFPAMVSGIVEPIISIVDTAFVGRLGATDLAGVGLASSFFLLLVWMLSQTKSAVTANVANFYGKGNIDKIRGLVPIALWLNISIGVVLFFGLLPVTEWIFTSYGATGELHEKACSYFVFRSLGFPLTLGILIMFGAFRGLQNTSWPMWTSLVGGLVNLILDPILIFGIPDLVEPMGIVGAAWASVLAQCAMFSMALIILLKRTPFNFFPKTLKHPKTKGLLMLSRDLFIRTLAMNVAYYFGNRQATLLGDVQIAAHTIAMNIWLFSAYFLDGYAEAAMVLSGRLKGAQEWGVLWKTVWIATRSSVLVGTLIAIAYTLSYSVILSFFTDDRAVQLAFSGIFWIVIISQPINGLAFAMDGVFNGLGDGRLLRNTLIGSTVIIFLPVILYASVAGWGLAGVWLAFVLWMIARGVPLLLAFNSRYDSWR